MRGGNALAVRRERKLRRKASPSRSAGRIEGTSAEGKPETRGEATCFETSVLVAVLDAVPAEEQRNAPYARQANQRV